MQVFPEESYEYYDERKQGKTEQSYQLSHKRSRLSNSQMNDTAFNITVTPFITKTDSSMSTCKTYALSIGKQTSVQLPAPVGIKTFRFGSGRLEIRLKDATVVIETPDVLKTYHSPAIADSFSARSQCGTGEIMDIYLTVPESSIVVNCNALPQWDEKLPYPKTSKPFMADSSDALPQWDEILPYPKTSEHVWMNRSWTDTPKIQTSPTNCLATHPTGVHKSRKDHLGAFLPAGLRSQNVTDIEQNRQQRISSHNEMHHEPIAPLIIHQRLE